MSRRAASPADLRHNVTVNLLDGGFFGFALGMASSITVIPLFVSSLTSSAVLIGLIGTIRAIGWQLPQIFTAQRVARLKRFKPAVMRGTLNERIPFLFLALLAWNTPHLDKGVVLALTFALLIWHGLGGGITAVAWQSMIGHIIPLRRRGIFFGMQAAAANLLMGIGAILAGQVLERFSGMAGFTWCFGAAAGLMAISYIFLGMTREAERVIPPEAHSPPPLRQQALRILRADRSFRRFLVVRGAFPFALVGLNFYTVYAAQRLGADGITLGWLTAVFSVVQVLSNPLMGWMGDRVGYPAALGVGTLSAAGSAAFAWLAPGTGWMFPAYLLAGLANATAWPLALAMTLTYGSPAEQPTYIGLANTLVAPSSLLAPLIGGWLADAWGYQVAFVVALVCSLAILPLLPGLEAKDAP